MNGSISELRRGTILILQFTISSEHLLPQLDLKLFREIILAVTVRTFSDQSGPEVR